MGPSPPLACLRNKSQGFQLRLYTLTFFPHASFILSGSFHDLPAARRQRVPQTLSHVLRVNCQTCFKRQSMAPTGHPPQHRNNIICAYGMVCDPPSAPFQDASSCHPPRRTHGDGQWSSCADHARECPSSDEDPYAVGHASCARCPWNGLENAFYVSPYR